MALPFITAKFLAGAKLESTWGTAETVASEDIDTRIRDLSFSTEIDAYVRNFASGRHSKASAIMGKRRGTVTFTYDMAAGSGLGVAPKAAKFFKMCGATETVVATTSVSYTPDATKDATSGTMAFCMVPVSGNAIIVTMKGCMGNCVITLSDLGEPLKAVFTFTGALVSVADGSALALTSPDTSVPPGSVGSTITMASEVQRIGTFELDFGNDVQLKYDPADTTGYLGAYIASRNPVLRIDPQIDLMANDAVWTRWSTGAEGVFSFKTPASNGIAWTVSAPKAQLITLGNGDRNGEAIWTQEYELHESSGNDEWTLLLSA